MDFSTLDLTGSRTYLGVKLERRYFGWTARALYLLALAPFAWVALQFGNVQPFFVVLGLMAFSLHILHHFIADKLGSDGGHSLYASDIASLLAFDIVRRLKRERITVGDLLEAAVQSERGSFMLKEMGIDGRELLKACKQEVEDTVDLMPFLDYIVRMLPVLDERVVDGNILLYLLFQHIPTCKDVLHAADLSVDELQGVMQWEAFHHRFRLCSSSVDPETIRRAGSVGRSWIMGYTDALDWLTDELPTTQQTCGEGSVVIHRDVIESVLAVLSRARLRNILVLGKHGVGKRTMIRNVACVLHDHEVRNHLPFTRMLVLKTQQLMSGVENPDAFFLRAFQRASGAGNFLIVIEDLGVFLKSASQPLIAVFLKFLESRSIAIIGIADTQDYHNLVKTDPALDNMFEKIPVEDASDDETMKVLMAHSFAASARTGVTVTYKAMKVLIELSQRYLSARGGFPGKAIDIFDDVILRVKQSGETVMRESHVREIVSVRSRVNVQKVTQEEREKLLKLEDTMKERVIDQDWAVKSVVNSLKRARLELGVRKRPVGTFLFLGPTGVGKTQTAKVLAEEYFGSVDSVIRLDMNEFSNEDSVYGIIGSPSGGTREGFLAQRVQDNPFSLILLDEIEKAHPKVLNVFLQILDEGMLNDARGTRTDFRNTIIIATSNAGALTIRDYVKKHPNYDPNDFKGELLDSILKDRIFTPEFVNRFDDTILFTPLSQKTVKKVAALMLDEVLQEVQRNRGIHVKIEDDVLDALVEHGYNIEFGAREMRRTITDVIEDYLADYLLRNDMKRGETITIKKDNLHW